MWVVVAPPVPPIPAPISPSGRLTLLRELERPLWGEATAYDSANRLMVPLHAAFAAQDKVLIGAFSQHFAHCLRNIDSLPSTLLNRLQYLYLASEFLRLASEFNLLWEIPPCLPIFLKKEVLSIWEHRPVPHWSEPPFQGLGRRIHWKLDHKQVAKSYFRAISDDEFFILAIAADLCVYARVTPGRGTWIPSLFPLLTTAKRVLDQEGQDQPDGGWLFQPGVWTDHPDYLYAGHERIEPNLPPSPVQGIAWDSSHSHRFPLWLSSLANGFREGSPGRRRILDIRVRLEFQFFRHVLVERDEAFPGPRTRNFMDGTNGLYRYGYPSLGRNNAYAPFESSPSLLLGWWVFFGSKRSRELYRSLAKALEDPICLMLYAGPQRARSVPSRELLNPLSPSVRWYRMIAGAAAHLPLTSP